MDTKLFKKLIKEAVKEAIQEELKEILLEAVRAPKTVIQESYAQPVQTLAGNSTTPSINAREKYKELLSGMMESPASINTAGEGSALPAGEVNLDQIMGLISKR